MVRIGEGLGIGAMSLVERTRVSKETLRICIFLEIIKGKLVGSYFSAFVLDSWGCPFEDSTACIFQEWFSLESQNSVFLQ